MTHVLDDVKQHGCLQDISTYPFENLLQFIKLRVKQRYMPLEQVARRLIESSSQYYKIDMHLSNSVFPQVKYPCSFDNKQVFKDVVVDSSFTLSSKKRSDSWFLTYNGDIVRMKHATMNDCKDITICGNTLKSSFNFFHFPISSKHLHVYETDGDVDSNIVEFNLDSIKAKFFCLPIIQTFVLIPLLHTMK